MKKGASASFFLTDNSHFFATSQRIPLAARVKQATTPLNRALKLWGEKLYAC
ncbi:MAG: hypothetical protein ACJAYH_000904 [Celeribacter sp.]|jgi:hypothetical protein